MNHDYERWTATAREEARQVAQSEMVTLRTEHDTLRDALRASAADHAKVLDLLHAELRRVASFKLFAELAIIALTVSSAALWLVVL